MPRLSAGTTSALSIPQKVVDRLKGYIREKGIQPNQKIFPISYEAARTMVKKSGGKVGIRLRPHDLRRHAATYRQVKNSVISSTRGI